MSFVSRIAATLLMGILVPLSPPLAQAAVTLPPMISDNMVLQRSPQTRLWGKDAPSQKIVLTLGKIRSETTADHDGNWEFVLDLSQAESGPHQLVIEGSSKALVSNVLIGEVWLCSGQSNMAYTLDRSTGGAQEILQSSHPSIRQFTVSYNPSAQPQDCCKGEWKVADPSTTAAFSAVGYYFAKSLQEKLDTPVGIVRSAWAGTSILSWISEKGLDAVPELREINKTAKDRAAAYPALKHAYATDIIAWETATNRADRTTDPNAYAAPEVPEDDWKKVTLHNARFRQLGLPDAGVVWLRQKVVLPANTDPRRAPSINLIIGAFDQTYVNGRKVGQMTEANCPGPSASRSYLIPPDALKEGENLIAVRVYTPTEDASFGSAYIDVGVTRTQLKDEWLAKVEYELPALANKDYPKLPAAPGISPGALYNGMINPITPYTFAGVLWYQGEQDSGRKGSQYQTMLETLISDWREHFGAPLPVCILQLPNFGRKVSTLGNATWPNIREAQRRALRTSGTSLVPLIDLGEEDVHPPNKKPAGERAALSVLAHVYGKNEPSGGPLFEAMTVEGGKAFLSFQLHGAGLVAQPLPATYRPSYSATEDKPLVRNSPESELEGFAICGPDHQWKWAQAKVEGDRVVVWSPAVTEPAAVRYAWADNPTGNLYDTTHLPASPFQTDELK